MILCCNTALSVLWLCDLLSLLGVDVATSSDLNPPVALSPRAAQDARHVIFVHQIAVPCPLLNFYLSRVFLLILGQNKALSPTVLSSALDIGILAAGRPVDGLGDAEYVATVVVREVRLQVKSEVARRIRAA